jgi:hypothetical protein
MPIQVNTLAKTESQGEEFRIVLLFSLGGLTLSLYVLLLLKGGFTLLYYAG